MMCNEVLVCFYATPTRKAKRSKSKKDEAKGQAQASESEQGARGGGLIFQCRPFILVLC